MKNKKETFASLLLSHGYKFDLRPVFDDFLTMTLCSFSQNVVTGKSHDEDLYMATISRYPKDMVQDLFPKLLALLILEMEERTGDSSGNDILGEVYEANFYRKGASQYFTPWSVCKLIAECTLGSTEQEEPMRILDPCCGSGRMLITGSRVLGPEHRYYGIDIDHTCVKMTAINLFLNGVFRGEVMCGNSLDPDDFHMSYAISFLPFGIFRIDTKERSTLWHLHRNSFRKNPEIPKPEIVLPSDDGSEQGQNASQLQLF